MVKDAERRHALSRERSPVLLASSESGSGPRDISHLTGLQVMERKIDKEDQTCTLLLPEAKPSLPAYTCVEGWSAVPYTRVARLSFQGGSDNGC